MRPDQTTPKRAVRTLPGDSPDRRAEQFADTVPDPEDPAPPDDDEPVYRDGSPRNECWNSREWD